MKITIDIPDNIAGSVVDAFAEAYGYQAELVAEDGTASPNPQTKAQFAKEKVISFIKEVYKAHQLNLARLAAEEAADESIEADTKTIK